MKDYIGKYRIFGEFDQYNKQPNKDDTYIKCKHKAQVYRYNATSLILYTATHKAQKVFVPLLQLTTDIKPFLTGDTEILYIFSEKYLENILSIFKPYILGKNVKPNSVKTRRNLQK